MNHRKRLSFFIFCVALGLLKWLPSYAYTKDFNNIDHVPGEMIVTLASSVSKSYGPPKAISAVVKNIQQKQKNRVFVQPLQHSNLAWIIRVADDSFLSESIRLAQASPDVEIAEPNYLYHLQSSGLPNDPDFFHTWALFNLGQADPSGQLGTPGGDIHVASLWEEGIQGSQKVIVAIADTGIQWDHPDLAANLYEKSGSDNRDHANDVHGWNFIGNNNNSSDDNGHGTLCAGIIGAVGNNGVGIAGVNWRVSLLPLKIAENGSTTLAAATEAIYYATNVVRADIISASWVSKHPSEILKAAIQNARDAGILFVAAAGNVASDNDTTPFYPASYEIDNIISVAATDNRDQLASFSNFGKRTVHVAAPGVGIFSTNIQRPGHPEDPLYWDNFGGTSAATPFVAGIAALLKSANPTWSYLELKNRIIKGSDPVPELADKVIAGGRVNAFNAFHGIVPQRNSSYGVYRP